MNSNHDRIGRFAKAVAAVKRRKEAAHAASVVARAKRPAVDPEPGSKRTPEDLHSKGYSLGYGDTSNHVEGPSHTRGVVLKRIQRLNSDSGAAGHPFWTGYARGVRQASSDYRGHISKTQGRKTRTVRRLYHLEDKV